MSKAFTRESDDSSDQPIRLRPSPRLPPGTKNYLTQAGAERLRSELARLVEIERPRVAEIQDEANRKRTFQSLDQRIHQLEQTLSSAVVVPPPAVPNDVVRFGATVTVRESNGAEVCYRIGGADETELDRDWVSWLSPIARALLTSRVGLRVRFKFPDGEKELGIVAIAYE